jgi:hypothetical protein
MRMVKENGNISHEKFPRNPKVYGFYGGLKSIKHKTNTHASFLYRKVGVALYS